MSRPLSTIWVPGALQYGIRGHSRRRPPGVIAGLTHPGQAGSPERQVLVRDRWSASRGLLLLLALPLLAGCPDGKSGGPTREPLTDEPLSAVVAAINENVRAMNFLLRAGGVSASGRMVAADGHHESIEANGTLYFRRPRSLYLELSHTLAGKLELGSNNREFWYWEQLEHGRYYTGHHGRALTGGASPLALRPDHLVDILGMSELPEDASAPGSPTFVVSGDRYLVEFYETGEGGRLYKARTLFIERRKPYLVRWIIYYSQEGRQIMQADLENYDQVPGTIVRVPRKITLKSLTNESYVKLTFATLRVSDNTVIESKRIARSPLDRGEEVGEVLRLDEPASPQAPATDPGSQPTPAS